MQIALTFGLTAFAWIFFRAENLDHALEYVTGIFSISLFELPHKSILWEARGTILIVFVFVVLEWIGREKPYALAGLGMKWARPVRWAFYVCIVFLLMMYMNTEETPFIYFQF